MKRKKNCTPDEHTSSIIMRSKLNLLTEPENNNKQAALFILLLRVNPSFLVGEIFKRSCIICIKKQHSLAWRLQITTSHVIMQIQANFTAIAKSFFSTTYNGYFCALRLRFCYYGFDFLSRFLLETKESSVKLHGNRKGSNHIGCEFSVCP